MVIANRWQAFDHDHLDCIVASNVSGWSQCGRLILTRSTIFFCESDKLHHVHCLPCVNLANVRWFHWWLIIIAAETTLERWIEFTLNYELDNCSYKTKKQSAKLEYGRLSLRSCRSWWYCCKEMGNIETETHY